MSGDARRALNICRRATELSESRQGGSGLVGLKDIEAAVTEMFTSPKIMAMRSERHTLCRDFHPPKTVRVQTMPLCMWLQCMHFTATSFG